MSLYYHQDLTPIITAIQALGTKLDAIEQHLSNLYEYVGEMDSVMRSWDAGGAVYTSEFV